VTLPAPPRLTWVAATASVPLSHTKLEALRFTLFASRRGGGAWLWAALAAVHVPTDPDTTVRHVAALHEPRPDLFTLPSAASGTGVAEGAASSATRGGEPLLLSPATLRVEDLRAVFSVLVVLGKVFKQANP
jgi:hypothetical protein